MKKILSSVVLLLLILRFGASSALAQQAAQAISGRVISGADGSGIPGVTVLQKGTSNGISTSADGTFSLTAPVGSTLVFSAIGFVNQQVVATAQAMSVSLATDTKSLNEVVVVGYGTQRKSDLTGAVSSVTGKDLTQVATADPVQALQGKAAGVEVTSNSGQPGAGARIRVRGVGTINNADPLYVVDGFQTTDIGFLLPSDIASMEILKDASATAIYGSRGANGVVVITTKKGQVGKTQFNLSGYSGFQQIRKTLDIANAAQYATLVTEAYKNGGEALPANFTPSFPDAIRNNSAGTDFQNFVTQRGFITNYNLSASGGTEQNRFLVSGGYFQQDGIVLNTGLKKYIVRVNDELVLTQRVKAGIGASFTHSATLGNGGGPYVFNSALTASPITKIFNPDGSYAYDGITSFTPNLANSINNQKYNRQQYNSLFTNAYVEAKLVEGLSFRTNFGIRYDNNYYNNYSPQYFIGPNDQRSISQLDVTREQNTSWVWSNFLNYNKTFGEAHTVSATLGQESQRRQYNALSISAFDVPLNSALQYVTAARSANPIINSNYPQDETLLSYFGRANYSYRDRYLLTGTLRFDKSSKFLQNVRTGVFPSFGAAWRISEEEFMKSVPAITQLKLRGSWGRVGNQNAAPNYAYSARAVNNQLYSYGGPAGTVAPGIAVSQLTNPDLKWETAITTDFGVDVGVLDNKLTFTADYFDRRTKDMIALLPVADYVGRAPAPANVASLRNRGLEMALEYRSNAGKFTYDVNLNMTIINNKVTSLGGANPIASGNVLSQIGNTTLTDVGREVAYFYGLKDLGVFHTQGELDAYKDKNGQLIQPNAKLGDVKYQDTNGDGIIDGQDRVYLGSGTPNFSYGATVSLGYGGVDFRILLYGVQGAEIVNAQGFFLNKSSAFAGTWNNFYASRLDRWTPENSGSNQPRVTSSDQNGNDQFSSRHVENGSYLRARNIELGYTIPKTFSSRYGIGGFRVYAAVDNPFVITKYTGLDPEVSSASFYNNPLAYGVDFGAYPLPRTYRLGLNVQF